MYESQTTVLVGCCSLSPTGDVAFCQGVAVGEEGRGEGATSNLDVAGQHNSRRIL